MINTQFNSGNYNEWDNLVKNIMPKANSIIRNELLPNIDNILYTMLGSNSEIERESIDVTQICENDALKGIQCDIVYTVDSFKVMNCPKEAIDCDIQTITNEIKNDKVTLKDIAIDTDSGELKICVEIDFNVDLDVEDSEDSNNLDD